MTILVGFEISLWLSFKNILQCKISSIYRVHVLEPPEPIIQLQHLAHNQSCFMYVLDHLTPAGIFLKQTTDIIYP